MEKINHYELYRFNLDLINSFFSIGSHTIYEIKKNDELILLNAQKEYSLNLDNNLPFHENYEHISAYINRSVFNTYCEEFSQSANFDDVKILIQNYGADQVWFTQYLSLLSAKSPEAAAIEIYKNLHDEIGYVPGSNDSSRFHPNIFRKLYKLFDIPPFNRFGEDHGLQEQTYACINTLLLSTKLDYLAGAGALFVLEETIPNQLENILNRLKNSGISYEDREFFEMHINLDKEHATYWWKICINPYLKSSHNWEQLLIGIALGLSARNFLWKGIYEKSSFYQQTEKVDA